MSHHGRTKRRRGSLYVPVMGVTMIVGMIGLASVTVSRLQIRNVVGQSDEREARMLAQSGIEYGFNWIDHRDDWRTVLSSGGEQTPTALGNGTFTWQAIDSDGDLDDDDGDSFTLRGIGRVGKVTAVEEVQVAPESTGLTCLEAAIHTNKHIDMKGNSITTNQTVSSNGEIKMASGAMIYGDAWSADQIENPAEVVGAALDNQSPTRDMPDADVFDYYVTNGASIAISDLPESSGARVISTILLSPANNPFGPTDPEGIYVIDCQNQKISILWSRFVGTLVLLNVGNDSGITAEVHWEPAVANYPCLMVQGDFSFDMTGLFGNHALWEGTLFKNFNPAGTPYEGQTDSDISDIYPGWINGLVYVSGLIEITDESYFNGAVVADDVHLDTNATFNYRDTFLTTPPPGFTSGSGGPLRITPGSWRQAAY